MNTELKIAFAEILKTEKELLQYSQDKDLDKYFKVQDLIKKQLVQFLRLEFTTLSKGKFLKLCDLVNSHRPVAPFSFLVSISMRKSKNG